MPKKGYKQSPERRIKSLLALEKAKLFRTPESNKKISEKLTGIKRGPMPKEHREKISKANKGMVISLEARLKSSESQIGEKNHRFGKTNSAKQRQAARESNLGRTGSKSPAWRGGITPLRSRIRQSTKYKEWRKNIYERDGYICVECGCSNNKLNAHHEKSFSKLLREAIDASPLLCGYDAVMSYAPFWDINNGKTLCENCHEKKHGKLNYITSKLHVA